MEEYFSVYETYIKPYYEQKCPWDTIYSLFVRGPNREVALFGEGTKFRFRSVKSGAELKEIVMKWEAHTVHIGSDYDGLPSGNGKIIGRDVCFDLDLNDYDGDKKLRFCSCAGQKKACPDCWIYVLIARTLIIYVFNVMFGLPKDNIIASFSGRRGAHFWILDYTMSTLVNTEDRKQRFDILWDREKVVQLYKLGHVNVLDMVHLCKSVLKGYLKSSKDEVVLRGMNLFEKLKNLNGGSEDLAAIAMGWPLFDQEVTTSNNHLIKCPLTMHADTGNICTIMNDDYICPFKKKITIKECVEYLKPDMSEFIKKKNEEEERKRKEEEKRKKKEEERKKNQQ